MWHHLDAPLRVSDTPMLGDPLVQMHPTLFSRRWYQRAWDWSRWQVRRLRRWWDAQ